MNRHLSWSAGRILLWAVAIALPLTFTGAGCGRTACFVWSKAEGACPAQDKALRFFSDPGCPGGIVSVDGPPEAANDLCCYAVTKDDTAAFGDNVPCASPPPNQGAGGAFSATVTGAGGSFSGGGGFGGADGGPPSCLRCQQAFSQQGLDPAGVCADGSIRLNLLSKCLCQGACASVCGTEPLCQGGFSAGMPCLACLNDSSAKGCGIQLENCMLDH